MAEYRVQFSNGSSDIIEANSAAEAREIASKDFGRVKKVEIVEYDDDLEDDEDDEDEDEDDEEDEDADEVDDAPARKRK